MMKWLLCILCLYGVFIHFCSPINLDFLYHQLQKYFTNVPIDADEALHLNENGGIGTGSKVLEQEPSPTTRIVDPNIYEAFKKHLTGSASFIVTFQEEEAQHASQIEKASNSQFLYQYFRSAILPTLHQFPLGKGKLIDWCMTHCFEIFKNWTDYATSNLAHLDYDAFKRSKLLRIIQGLYVYETRKDALVKSQKCVEENLQKFPKWKSIKKYIVSNSWAMEGDIDVIKYLLTCPEVAEIHLNTPFIVPNRPNTLEIDDPLLSYEVLKMEDAWPSRDEWNIAYIGAPKVWNVTKGGGLIYASSDTGVDWRHPVITNNYAGRVYSGKDTQVKHDYAWWDAIKVPLSSTTSVCGIDSKEPCDDLGHGTHTTSVAVGSDGFGVAPEALWIACKNMDKGVGSSTSYLDCLEFFIAPTDLLGLHPDPSRRPHVIGNSYGCPDYEGCAPLAFHKAVRTVHQSGIFMSVSAGNEGPDCGSISSPPAFEPLVFTVGATRYQSDAIAGYSSRGPIFVKGLKYPSIKPNLVAPGSRIRGAHLGGAFKLLSGTSMACPHVAGSVLLLSSACPAFYRQVLNLTRLLLDSSRPLSVERHGGLVCGSDHISAVPNNVYGYGMIQVDHALKHCMGINV